MEDINERIILCIKKSGLTKTAFAKKIDVSQPFVSQLCSGAAMPSNRTIKDICRVFDISEEWLRTGKGEMDAPKSEDEELAAAINQIAGTSPDFRRRLIAALSALNDDQWVLLEDMLMKLVGTQKAEPTVEQQAAEVRAKVGAAAEKEFILEKKAEGESSVSPSDTGSADAEKMA